MKPIKDQMLFDGMPTPIGSDQGKQVDMFTGESRVHITKPTENVTEAVLTYQRHPIF